MASISRSSPRQDPARPSHRRWRSKRPPEAGCAGRFGSSLEGEKKKGRKEAGAKNLLLSPSLLSGKRLIENTSFETPIQAPFAPLKRALLCNRGVHDVRYPPAKEGGSKRASRGRQTRGEVEQKRGKTSTFLLLLAAAAAVRFSLLSLLFSLGCPPSAPRIPPPSPVSLPFPGSLTSALDDLVARGGLEGDLEGQGLDGAGASRAAGCRRGLGGDAGAGNARGGAEGERHFRCEREGEEKGREELRTSEVCGCKG